MSDMSQDEMTKLLDRGRLVEMIERQGYQWVQETFTNIIADEQREVKNGDRLKS